MKSRIMYVESKAGGLTGPARIGRVTFSKTGATLYYRGKTFRSLRGSGFKSNYYDVETGEEYWISGPKKNGEDGLYATNIKPEIDVDVYDEYWSEIRGWQTLVETDTPEDEPLARGRIAGRGRIGVRNA